MRVRFRQAMHEALYGPDGFYTRNRPAQHFRTSAHSPLFAHAIAKLVVQVDTALGGPSTLDIVDLGAGGGELLNNLLTCLPDAVRKRSRPVAVELTTRLGSRHAVEHAHKSMIDWKGVVPEGIVGVLIATEWLDNVPLDLAQDGHYLWDGAPLSPEDAKWIERWWPDLTGIVEIGRARDEAWAEVVGKVRAGLALTVDYGHLTGTRPERSTVAGFRDGREVEPLFDGSTDITCHVAVDSAGSLAGTVTGGYRLKRQREALQALGVEGTRPPLELAHSHPHEYVRALADASEAAVLTDPDGLGGHWWLQHPVGIPCRLGRKARPSRRSDRTDLWAAQKEDKLSE